MAGRLSLARRPFAVRPRMGVRALRPRAPNLQTVRMPTLDDDLDLPADRVRRTLEPTSLPWASTADIEPLRGILGQPRAVVALDFGVSVTEPGYNLFVAGAEGLGRETAVREHLARVALERPTPPDLVYVHDFANPERPRPLRLPPGRGAELVRAMDQFVEAAQRDLPRAFDSEDYERRHKEALAGQEERRDALLAQLRAFAADHNFAVETTEAGIVVTPLHAGAPLTEAVFATLSAEERQATETARAEVEAYASSAARSLSLVGREAAERERVLDETVARFAVGPLFEDLRQRFEDLPEVRAWLDDAQADVPAHLEDFWPADAELEDEDDPIRVPAPWLANVDPLVRYRVNLLVDHAGTQGAPVVFEANPTAQNLMGYIEHVPRFGELATDFRHVRAGALHRASGGFLILRVRDFVEDEAAWNALARTLRSGEVLIERVPGDPGDTVLATLRPRPVHLDVKVVLLGPDELWHDLCAEDEDFVELFRVKVDFASEMPWNDDGVRGYAAFASKWVRDHGLRHLDRGALARLIEHGARLRGHQGRLTTRLREIADVMTEASFWAVRAEHALVQVDDIERAVSEKRHRSDLLEERLRDLAMDGTLVVQTQGLETGQVNALGVVVLGDLVFGRPMRVTATVGAGRGRVRSIERDVRLSDPTHAKGVLALSGYLSGRFGQDAALAVTATVTFEQTYEGVEGDSASAAELVALLSALGDLPVDQARAVTGAVDQHGLLLPVGGVNEKIEGFFALCAARGLSGDQGVVVPAGNVLHLMLDPAVVAAVRERRFHVWAAHDVSEVLTLLTGTPPEMAQQRVNAKLVRLLRVQRGG